MQPRSKKLVWELLGVLAKYSERDVEDALKILSTGSFLQPSATLLELVASTKRKKSSSTRPLRRERHRLALVSDVERAYNMIDSSNLGDREALRDFAEGVAVGRYLKGTRLLRDFASNLDIDLPKKLPSRQAIALSLTTKLIRLDRHQRTDLLEVGRRMDENSSLKAWSDLIVR